jgi:hypothetical protein
MKDTTLNRPAQVGDRKSAIRFHTTLLRAGKTATGIQIPDEVIARLGSGKRPAVRITINGYSYRSTVAVMGGRFMVGVSAENREKASVEGGDELDVVIELDNEPREVAVPPEFAAELDRDPKARKRFEALSYSKKKLLLRGIVDAKTEETRRRHIDRALAELRA